MTWVHWTTAACQKRHQTLSAQLKALMTVVISVVSSYKLPTSNLIVCVTMLKNTKQSAPILKAEDKFLSNKCLVQTSSHWNKVQQQYSKPLALTGQRKTLHQQIEEPDISLMPSLVILFYHRREGYNILFQQDEGKKVIQMVQVTSTKCVYIHSEIRSERDRKEQDEQARRKTDSANRHLVRQRV